MAKKTEVSPEKLEQILTAYDRTGTYAGAARESGMSVSIVTRLIKESMFTEETQMSKPVDMKYIGPPPIEVPDREAICTFFNMSDDWMGEYYEVH